ncbi:MAG TPA: hypothetical protein VFX04_09605 [Rhodanobacteraceae bacterium]|jgi:hypothetical protein|nr:hypothetical protein [Rhodanobacteraceae bacterium]
MRSDPHIPNRTAGNESGNRPPRTPQPETQSGRDTSAEERERLLDEELTDTFPASDPPSWTMGGSVVSTRRH